METAAQLAASGYPVAPSEAFHECDFGAWTRLAFPALEALPEWRRFNALRYTIRTASSTVLAVSEYAVRIEGVNF
jgi:broad specificity phosphatase PhoE